MFGGGLFDAVSSEHAMLHEAGTRRAAEYEGMSSAGALSLFKIYDSVSTVQK